jgi:hypothetical protein
MDIIYLACIIELANVIMKRSYPPLSLSWTERYRCIAAHGKARTVLAWISERYKLYMHDGKILNPFDDIFSWLLGQQAAILFTYRQENPPSTTPSNNAPHVSLSDLKTSIKHCLANNVIASTVFANNIYNIKKVCSAAGLLPGWDTYFRSMTVIPWLL